MKISIAMCTYNGARYVRDQLESIGRQIRLPDELILSDDASTDETKRIVEDFAQSAPFPVSVSVNAHRLGIMRNFEKAIRLCSGEVIALSDWDDVWAEGKLKLIEQSFLKAPQVGLIFTEAEIVDSSLNSVDRKLSESVGFNRRKQRLVRQGKVFDILLAQTLVSGATMAFRSEFNDIILPLPCEGPLNHDGWIALVMAPVTNFAFIAQPTIKYRVHSGQCVGIQAKSRIQSMLGASKTDANFYLAQTKQFQEAYHRLEGTRRIFRDQSALSKLQDKIHHLTARASMPARKRSRFSCVFKELANLHYHRFSRGWFSAGKDLLV